MSGRPYHTISVHHHKNLLEGNYNNKTDTVTNQYQKQRGFPSQDYSGWDFLQQSLSTADRKIRMFLNKPDSDQSVYYDNEEALELASTLINNYVRIMRQVSLESPSSDVKKYFVSERTLLPLTENLDNSSKGEKILIHNESNS